MPEHRDQIYMHEQPHVDFVFDERVASVFSDMIERSVPGYATIISMIGMFAERYGRPGTRAYDLGCSLGAATLAMRHHLPVGSDGIVAVDNSAAMIARCQAVIEADTANVPVELVCADLFDVDIQNACVVVLNFTLQFISPAQRSALLRKIHAGMVPGGLLVLSEKVRFEDADLDALFIDLHHRFKQQNGYSQMEISRKRAALENVLIPETIATHEQRIEAAGFDSFDVWFQCFNFASMVAVK